MLSTSRIAYNRDFIENGCPEEMYDEMTSVDDTVATYATSFVITFICTLIVIKMFFLRKKEKDALASEEVGSFFISQALSFLSSGVQHAVIKREDAFAYKILLRTTFGFAGLGGMVLLQLVMRLMGVYSQTSTKKIWKTTTLITSGSIVVYATAVNNIYMNAMLLYFSVLMILVVYLRNFFISRSNSRLGGQERIKNDHSLKAFGTFLMMCGMTIQLLLEGRCGKEGYKKCFQDCPLKPTLVFNHNALFHCIYTMGLIILGWGEFIHPITRPYLDLRRKSHQEGIIIHPSNTLSDALAEHDHQQKKPLNTAESLTSPALSFIRFIYAVQASFIACFIFLACIQFGLFLSFCVTIEAGLTTRKEMDLILLIGILCSIPTYISFFSQAMAVATTFVIDSYNGFNIMKNTLAVSLSSYGGDLTNVMIALNSITLICFLLVPIAIACILCLAGSTQWWEYSVIANFFSLLSYFLIYTLSFILYETKVSFELIRCKLLTNCGSSCDPVGCNEELRIHPLYRFVVLWRHIIQLRIKQRLSVYKAVSATPADYWTTNSSMTVQLGYINSFLTKKGVMNRKFFRVIEKPIRQSSCGKESSQKITNSSWDLESVFCVDFNGGALTIISNGSFGTDGTMSITPGTRSLTRTSESLMIGTPEVPAARESGSTLSTYDVMTDMRRLLTMTVTNTAQGKGGDTDMSIGSTLTGAGECMGKNNSFSSVRNRGSAGLTAGSSSDNDNNDLALSNGSGIVLREVVRVPTGNDKSAVTKKQMRNSIICFFFGRLILLLVTITHLYWIFNISTVLMLGIVIVYILYEAQILTKKNKFDTKRNELTSKDEEDTIEDAQMREGMSDFTFFFKSKEVYRVIEPTIELCWAALAFNFAFFFLYPLVALLTAGYAQICFTLISISMVSCNALRLKLGYWFDEDLVKTFYQKNRLTNNEDGVKTIFKEANAVSRRAKFWKIPIFIFLAAGSITVANSRIPFFDTARPAIQFASKDDFVYHGSNGFKYATCSLGQNLDISDKLSLADFLFLSMMPYYEDDKKVDEMTASWFESDDVTNLSHEVSLLKNDYHFQFSTNSSIALNIFNVPINTSTEKESMKILSIRGTANGFDSLNSAVFWLNSGLLVIFRMFLPFGDFWFHATPYLLKILHYGEESVFSELSYFKETRAFVQSLQEGGSNVMLVGYSLGGGVAMVTAAQMKVPAIAISGLNSIMSRKIFYPEITEENLNKFTFNVVPDNDIVPRMDELMMNYQRIRCRAKSNKAYTCHKLERSLCEILYTCGSNNRPIPCYCVTEFGYDQPTSITGKSFEESCIEV